MAANWVASPLQFYIWFQFGYWLNVTFIAKFFHYFLIRMEMPKFKFQKIGIGLQLVLIVDIVQMEIPVTF
jgi:hypothetical protein